MKIDKSLFPLSLLAAALTLSIPACDSKPSSDPSLKALTSKQSVGKPSNIDATETEKLFGRLKTKRVAPPNGGVAGSAQSIFLHPSVNGPTSATFDVSGMSGKRAIEGWIAPLPAGIGPEAGIVEVDVLLDGKSLGKFDVTRDKNMRFVADLNGKSELTVVVDAANGTDGCDWFNFGITK
jgi:hypothetical protein